MVLIWYIGPSFRSNLANKKLTCVKLTIWFTSFITMPNFSDSLLHFKCSPSHSVMVAIEQTKTFLPYLLALDNMHLLYACALSRTPTIGSTHFSPSHRVLKYTRVRGGGFQFIKPYLSNVELHSTVRSIVPGPKSNSNRYVILQVFFFWGGGVGFPKLLPSNGPCWTVRNGDCLEN